MSTTEIPFCVEPGWVHSDLIRALGEPHDFRLLTYADGTVRFEHVCNRVGRGVIICAPALQIGAGHTLTRNAAGLPTVVASIQCDDCGTHGYVTNGRWAA